MALAETERDGNLAGEGAADDGLEPRSVGVLIRSIRKSYGGFVALHGVSLAIRKGEFFSLLGPSGCGKTTLLRIIGGFEDYDSGTLQIDGQDCGNLPPYRRNTNMIFQHLALFPHMDVFENIAFGLRRKRTSAQEIKARVGEALALVRLEGYERRNVDQLSGGQRQRVAMARAIVNKPSVLLLDEPLGALDLQLRLQLQDELRRLHRSLGSTFVFVTHDQGEAMTMSDRIAVMNEGHIQQVGTPQEIYERPRTRFVASFIGHTNLFAGRVADSSVEGRCTVDCGGLRFTCMASLALARGQDVSVALRFEKVDVQPLETVAPVDGFTARVVDRTYMGTAVRFETRLDSGLAITADVSDVERVRGVGPGSRVRLVFADGAAVAVAN
ncbi:MAG TPA: ABC transporter ATP-binding protein [Alphaproteobacteria bacterium]|nr:ABC transporter ATP-binding protein [Alphaproteobacteria bacterium]